MTITEAAGVETSRIQPVGAQALVAREFGAPPRLETITVPPPGPGEVRIAVRASGVCGSDMHVVHGPSTAVRVPTVLGHEGAGVVEAVGAGVDGLAVGDHVVAGLGIWCGECARCLAGEAWLCTAAERGRSMFGLRADGRSRVQARGAGGEDVHTFLGVGTLADYALAPARQVVKVDPALPLDELCLLGCGVLTGVGAALNTARVRPGESTVVIGCGGVGLSVVQGARIAGATRIVAIDPSPRKLELARSLGATRTVDPSHEDVREAVLGLVPGGVDHAFEVVGRPELATQALSLVRPAGTAYVVGILPPGSSISVPRELLMGEKRLMTSSGGGAVGAVGIPALVELYRTGALSLDEMVDQRLPLDRVLEAFAAMETGELARNVIVFDGGRR